MKHVRLTNLVFGLNHKDPKKAFGVDHVEYDEETGKAIVHLLSEDGFSIIASIPEEFTESL